MILKMEMTDLGFRFEWHPEAQAVYAMFISTGLKHEQIASGVTSPEQAQFSVTMWCRGYRSRMREAMRDPTKRHFHLLAETGKLKAKAP